MRGKYKNRVRAKPRQVYAVAAGYGPRHAFNAQEGAEAVPEELPSPPAGKDQELSVYGKAMSEVARQVRDGVLPPEALAAIRTDPTSLKALAGYAGVGAGLLGLAGGGEGGEIAPGEVQPVLTRANRNGTTIRASFDATRPAPDAKALEQQFADAGHNVSVTKFKPDLLSATKGEHNYRFDVSDAQGRMSSAAAAKAMADMFGEDAPYRGQTQFESQVPLSERYGAAYDYGTKKMGEAPLPEMEESVPGDFWYQGVSKDGATQWVTHDLGIARDYAARRGEGAKVNVYTPEQVGETAFADNEGNLMSPQEYAKKNWATTIQTGGKALPDPIGTLPVEGHGLQEGTSDLPASAYGAGGYGQYLQPDDVSKIRAGMEEPGRSSLSAVEEAVAGSPDATQFYFNGSEYVPYGASGYQGGTASVGKVIKEAPMYDFGAQKWWWEKADAERAAREADEQGRTLEREPGLSDAEWEAVKAQGGYQHGESSIKPGNINDEYGLPTKAALEAISGGDGEMVQTPTDVSGQKVEGDPNFPAENPIDPADFTNLPEKQQMEVINSLGYDPSQYQGGGDGGGGLQVINDLGYNPSYPYGSSGSGVPTQKAIGLLGNLFGGAAGNLLIPGLGGIIGGQLGGAGARMLTRRLQQQSTGGDGGQGGGEGGGLAAFFGGQGDFGGRGLPEGMGPTGALNEGIEASLGQSSPAGLPQGLYQGLGNPLQPVGGINIGNLGGGGGNLGSIGGDIAFHEAMPWAGGQSFAQMSKPGGAFEGFTLSGNPGGAVSGNRNLLSAKAEGDADIMAKKGKTKIVAAQGFGPRHANNAKEGTSTDTVPAMLTPREAVLNRNAAELAGRQNIQKLNAQGNDLADEGVDLAARGQSAVPAFLPKAGATPGAADYLKFMPFSGFRRSDKALTTQPRMGGVGLRGYAEGEANMKKPRKYQTGVGGVGNATDPLSMYQNKLGANTPTAGGGPSPMPIPTGRMPPGVDPTPGVRPAPTPMGAPTAPPPRPDRPASSDLINGQTMNQVMQSKMGPNLFSTLGPQLQAQAAANPYSYASPGYKNTMGGDIYNTGVGYQSPLPPGQSPPGVPPGWTPPSNSFFPPPNPGQNAQPFQSGGSDVTPIGGDNPKDHQVWQDIQYSAPHIDIAALKSAAQQNKLDPSTVSNVLKTLQGIGAFGGGSSAMANAPGGAAAWPEGTMSVAYQRGISDIGYAPEVGPSMVYHGDKGGWLGPFDPRWTFQKYWRGTGSVAPLGGLGPVMGARPFVHPVRPVAPLRF